MILIKNFNYYREKLLFFLSTNDGNYKITVKILIQLYSINHNIIKL